MYDELIRKFCLKMKMYKVECSTVYKCAMFQGFLKRHGIDDASVKQGYYVLGENACRHYWVQVGDEKIDITMYLSSVPFPGGTMLQEEISPDTKRIDVDNKLVSENETQFESFQTNVKQFWKDAPLSIRKFKH